MNWQDTCTLESLSTLNNQPSDNAPVETNQNPTPTKSTNQNTYDSHNSQTIQANKSMNLITFQTNKRCKNNATAACENCKRRRRKCVIGTSSKATLTFQAEEPGAGAIRDFQKSTFSSELNDMEVVRCEYCTQRNLECVIVKVV
jgi:hypothetical protein